MCILPLAAPQSTPHATPCPAQSLLPQQRQHLAVQALAGAQPIAHLAQQHHVSRKFVYQQADKADRALQAAFTPQPDDDTVLFYLPITKAWIRQLILALVLICHSSLRGVVELLGDLFDYPISLGTVHHILHSAVPDADRHNRSHDLSAVGIAALDEIFQTSQPVLVGCDVASTFCFLLQAEPCRDGDTWGVRLLELADRGLAPQATITDGGTGLRAGLRQGLPDVPHRGDVWHALHEVAPAARYLDNRAYEALAAVDKLQRQLARPGKRRDQMKRTWAARLRLAGVAAQRAVTLADDVGVLLDWLREDILAVGGLDYVSRAALYDFVVAELRRREEQCRHRLEPVRKYLENQRDDLLAWSAQLERDLTSLAAEHQVSLATAYAVLHVQSLPEHDVRRGAGEARLWQALRGRYHPLRESVAALLRGVVRASSVVENLNSRLRNYFFLRRELGAGYLSLLQFYLNHRRFPRSGHAERVGKSPSELLTGQEHGHWLELLGYQRFCRQ